MGRLLLAVVVIFLAWLSAEGAVSSLPSLSETPWAQETAPKGFSENAYAAILYGGTPRDYEFFMATRVMFRSLRSFGTNEDLVALVASNLPVSWRRILAEEDGVRVIEVDNAPNPYAKQKRYDPRFVHAMNKIWAWGLLDYKRVVLLDADNLFLRNVDELFKCGEFCAVFINPCIFHTGLTVLAPSNDTLNDMLARAHALESYDGGDQGFLNSYFADLLAAPLFEPDAPAQQHGLFRLPFGYQMDQSYYYQRFQWEVPCSAKSVITFPGMSQLKPWYWWSAPFLPYQWHETRRALLGYSAELPAAVTGAVASIAIALLAVAVARKVRGNKWAWCRPVSLLLPHQAKPLVFSALTLAFLLPLWIVPRTMHPIAGWGLYLLHSGGLLVCLYCLSGVTAAIFIPWAVFAAQIALLAVPWATNCFQRIAFAIALLCMDAVLAYWVSNAVTCDIDAMATASSNDRACRLLTKYIDDQHSEGGRVAKFLLPEEAVWANLHLLERGPFEVWKVYPAPSAVMSFVRRLIGLQSPNRPQPVGLCQAAPGASSRSRTFLIAAGAGKIWNLSTFLKQHEIPIKVTTAATATSCGDGVSTGWV
eukprot:jgi/Chlat1/503/Chrsp103S01099